MIKMHAHKYIYTLMSYISYTECEDQALSTTPLQQTVGGATTFGFSKAGVVENVIVALPTDLTPSDESFDALKAAVVCDVRGRGRGGGGWQLCVCVRMCMYVYKFHVFMRKRKREHTLTHTHTHSHTHTHTHTHTHMRTYVHKQAKISILNASAVHLCMCVCLYAGMLVCVCVYVYAYVCLCVCVCVYVCMYVCTHTHTHTRACSTCKTRRQARNSVLQDGRCARCPPCHARRACCAFRRPRTAHCRGEDETRTCRREGSPWRGHAHTLSLFLAHLIAT